MWIIILNIKISGHFCSILSAMPETNKTWLKSLGAPGVSFCSSVHRTIIMKIRILLHSQRESSLKQKRKQLKPQKQDWQTKHIKSLREQP